MKVQEGQVEVQGARWRYSRTSGPTSSGVGGGEFTEEPAEENICPEVTDVHELNGCSKNNFVLVDVEVAPETLEEDDDDNEAVKPLGDCCLEPKLMNGTQS